MMTLEECGNRTAHRLLAGNVGVSLMSEDERKIPKVCFHEASHCVVNLYYGHSPLRITVRADGSGLTESEPTPGLENLPPTLRPDVDRLQVVKEIMEHAGETLDFDKLEGQTAALLLREWIAVSTIAQRLAELLGDNPEAVMDGAEAVRIWRFLKGENDGPVQ